MALGFLRGAAAGAAGTTALNAATYLDMAVRGRGSSSAPQDLVKAVADRADIAIPGHSDERDNRLAGLGPLSGAAVGLVVGAGAATVLGVLRERGVRLPAPIPVVLIGAAAMALSDVPLKLFGISDPSDWEGKDWAADAIRICSTDLLRTPPSGPRTTTSDHAAERLTATAATTSGPGWKTPSPWAGLC
jgi:hypothetical protein